MKRWWALGWLVVVGAALALRLPQLDRRPMHNDEAVNAIKFRNLWDRGKYAYDPNEFHGPTLAYVTLAAATLSPTRRFERFSAATFRRVTVGFGVGLVLLLPLLADGLGRAATLAAAALTAISPAMVFYSRYYIHEMLLVFFTALLLTAAWRYHRTRRLGWCLVAGVGLGLMAATKETFVLATGALAMAVLAARLWERRQAGTKTPLLPCYRRWHLAAAGAVALLIAGVLFSSFFTNARGPLDALGTYSPWLHRASGHSPHRHPVWFYFRRLFWFHAPGGPVWSEGLILVLAVVGGVAALRRDGLKVGSLASAPPAAPGTHDEVPPSPALGRAAPSLARRPGSTPPGGATGRPSPYPSRTLICVLTFYTAILTLVYSLIPYKTPWCLLGFWQGMLLLAGVGAVVAIRGWRRRWLRVAAAVVLVAAAVQLGWQAWRASFPLSASRANPYVYAQTSPDLLNLVRKVEALARVSPEGRDLLIKVMATDGDYWPLPWYLRQFRRVGWWSALPRDPWAPVMIVSAGFHAAFDAQPHRTHLMAGYFQLRPEVFLELYVDVNLWRAYVASLPPSRE